MTDPTRPTKPTVSTQQADFVLFNRFSLRLLAAGILPRTTTSIVAMGVSGGGYTESKVEATAIERATITLVVDEAERSLKEYVVGWDSERAESFGRVMRLWYGKGGKLTWRKIGRRVGYVEQHCRYLRGRARKYVAERLSQLPGTAMADFWDVVDRLGRLAEESRANERRARSGRVDGVGGGNGYDGVSRDGRGVPVCPCRA